jgi:hypothetical protein
MANRENITIIDAEIMSGNWRNFGGAEGQFNRAGERQFNLRLPDELAEHLKSQGYNVRTRDPREDGDDPLHRLEVAVEYDKGTPPMVYYIVGGQRTLLDRETVGLIDSSIIEKADIIISPYHWEVNGKTGTKAYLHKAFITIEEDELDALYRDVPIAGATRGD